MTKALKHFAANIFYAPQRAGTSFSTTHDDSGEMKVVGSYCGD